MFRQENLGMSVHTQVCTALCMYTGALSSPLPFLRAFPGAGLTCTKLLANKAAWHLWHGFMGVGLPVSLDNDVVLSRHEHLQRDRCMRHGRSWEL